MPVNKVTAKKTTATKRTTARKVTAGKTSAKATAKKATARKANAKEATARGATARGATARGATARGATPVGRVSATTMPVKRGDLIVIDSSKVGSQPREGEVLQVIHGDVSVSYRVKWADGNETLISPIVGSARFIRA
jgi:hypothetical protein